MTSKNVGLKLYFKNILLLAFVMLGHTLFAQLGTKIHWYSDSVGCGGNGIGVLLQLKETEVSSSPIVKRTWTLYKCGNDSLITTVSSPADSTFTPTISTPGCYCVKFTETNSAGVTGTDSDCNISIKPEPTAGATFGPVEGCIPFVTDITCTSTSAAGTPINSFIVQFNPGNVNESLCPNGPVAFTFAAGAPTGYINAVVGVTNTAGCAAHVTYDSAIYLIPNPIASFTQDTADAECTNGPLTVIFKADSTDPHLTYTWYVNNVQKQSSAATRVFTYTFPLCNCCYDITLVVRHPSGCSDSLVKHNDVCVATAPIITYSRTADSICAPGSFTLTNTSPNITSLTWKLSGGTPNIVFPTVTGQTATYTITNPGVYTLIVSGSSAAGCAKTDTAIVLNAFVAPVAAFTVSDTFNCTSPDTVTLIASPCAGCTYQWNGFAALSPKADTTAGVFLYGSTTVGLTVTLKYGNFACNTVLSKPGLVKVMQLMPKISSTGYMGCLPECFTLKDATSLTGFPPSVTIASACWSFPGSIIPSGCGDTLQRCITTPGCDTVSLTVTTSNGCTNKVVAANTFCASAPPQCTMTVNKDTMCYEQDTVLFALTCDSISFIRVNFGDAGANVFVTFDSTHFSHIYQDTGHITTTVIVYRDSCAGDTLVHNFLVYPPVANFNDSISCASKDTVYFINKSIGATSYLWKFCNGDTSTLLRPRLVLPYCDTCSATLTAYNSVTGCVHHKHIAFNTPCDSASYTPMDTSICAGQYIDFINTSANVQGSYWDFNCADSTFIGAPSNLYHSFNNPGIFCIGLVSVSTSGCVDTVYGSVNVCSVKANFTFDTVCFPAPICFHDTSTVYCTPTVWHWHFGDGTTDTARNPCHVYANPGTYNVSLAVYSGGCADSVGKVLTTANVVAIHYNVDTIVCPGTQSCVTNTSSGNNLTYNWQMPGASPPSSTAAAPCYAYNTPGNYTIYLQLSSNHQCSVYDTIKVHAFSPIAGGYLDTNFLACPLPYHVIQFTDTSKYVNGTWSWSFGDGYGSNAPSTGHVYDHPGVYVVTLITTDKAGCADTAVIDTVTILGPFGTFVEAPLPGICACKDSMTYIINTYDATKISLVYGCNSGFEPDTILNVGTQANPTAFTFKIPYCLTGECMPEVQYGDNNQCLVLDSLPVILVDSPTIKFSFNNFGVCSAGSVCFHDSTQYHLPAAVSYTLNRQWDFGDGTTDTSANPCHYYSQPGGYVVRLYIHSNLGCSDSSIGNLVVVPAPPVAGYYASDSFVCAHSSVCFYDTSIIYPLTHAWFRIWDFGDGTPVDTVYADSVCHLYKTAGFYRVRMCVYDSIGCFDCDSSILMHVIPIPVANAGGNQTLCYGVVAQLHGSGGVNYMWQPAGLFSNPDTANTTLQLFQDTTIELIVTDIYGCVDTDTVVLTAARVFAAFTVNPTVCKGDSLCVKDASTNINGQLVQWIYNFGDSAVIPGKNVCHPYAQSGNYIITHVVNDNHGCTDTATANVVVFSSPVAAFTVSDTVTCSNQPVCFTNQSTSATPITSWLWNFDDNVTSNLQNPPCHLFAPPYISPYVVSLIVTDANNCMDTAFQNIILHVKPHADFTSLAACVGDSMPFSNTSTPGTSPVGYCQWTFWLGAPNPVIDSNCFTSFQLPAGTHSVQLVVTDLSGCRDTVVKAVKTDSLSELVIYPGDTTICLGSAVDYAVMGVFDRITWVPDTWISNPNSPVVTINPLQDITYTVVASNGVCAPAQDTFTMLVIQPIPIIVSDSPSTIVLGFSSYLFSSEEGQHIDSIVWNPDSTLDCRACANPVATPIQTTTYTATIYYSRNGVTCTNYTSITIDVITTCDGRLIYVPNTFTPNGDGIDDIFRLRGAAANARIKEFRIFDRWGRLVFESLDGVLNDPHYGWNGEDMAGRKLNPDVYVYTYQIQCSDGNIVAGHGNVTLLR